MNEFELTRKVLGEPEADPAARERARARLQRAIEDEQGPRRSRPSGIRLLAVAASFTLIVVLALALTRVLPFGGRSAAPKFPSGGAASSTDFSDPIPDGLDVTQKELSSGEGLAIAFQPRLPEGLSPVRVQMSPVTDGKPEDRQLALVFPTSDGASVVAFEYLVSEGAAKADLEQMSAMAGGQAVLLADGSTAATLQGTSTVGVFWYEHLTKAELEEPGKTTLVDPVVMLEVQGSVEHVSADDLVLIANAFVAAQ